jgi:tRNA (guanosine-2'-O-)-methyltransferase
MNSEISLETKIKLIEFLKDFTTESRIKRFEDVIQFRTRHITVALEDIYQSHNSSAVLRSCDCFGIQDVHIIESKNEHIVNPDVALGSSQWLDIKKYSHSENNTKDCIENLKNQGYQVFATTPHKNDCLIDDLNIENKVALIFGTEADGLSETALDLADGFVKIPMFGFTESFNISVSAAICMFNLTQRLRESKVNWKLSQSEEVDIKLNWLKQTIKSSESLEKKFLANL